MFSLKNAKLNNWWQVWVKITHTILAYYKI